LTPREPIRPFLQQEFMLSSRVRVRIQLRKQISISPQQRGGYGPKLDVRFEPREDGFARQVRIADDLPVVGGIPGHPMFQLDHQARVLGQDRFDFRRGGCHAVQVLQRQVRNICRVAILLLGPSRGRELRNQKQESSDHRKFPLRRCLPAIEKQMGSQTHA
jgi:hypothetical protein